MGDGPDKRDEYFYARNAAYGIVVSHLVKGIVKFAVVYDPSMRHVYTAEQGKGMFLNGERQQVGVVDARSPKVLLVISREWNPPALFDRFVRALTEFNIYRFPLSDGISYAYVASGKFDGVIALTKDTFPDFAGSLFIKEAGGIFTNKVGEVNIKPTDRVFVASHPSIHAKLLHIARTVLS